MYVRVALTLCHTSSEHAHVTQAVQAATHTQPSHDAVRHILHMPASLHALATVMLHVKMPQASRTCERVLPDAL
jgi:hypothetical protein